MILKSVVIILQYIVDVMPHGNHNIIIYSRHTEDKVKGIKVYHYRKIIRSPRKRSSEEEGNKGTTNQPANNYQSGNSKYIPTSCFCKCRWSKFSNHKTEWLKR